VRLVFAGTPKAALPSLAALAASGHDLVAVITRPDAAAGRGLRSQPSPVAERAAELGIETLKPARPGEEDFVRRLAELDPDCCPVVAYGALLPQRLLDIPRHGWVNLHFSLLPAWRGAAPVQHAILAGDRVTGASTFRLVAAMDAGPVYATTTETIVDTDTAGDLLDRLAVSGAALLVSTLDGIAAGTLAAQPQPEDGVTLAPKLTVADAHLDWTRPAQELDRRIRGCAPQPGAWTTLRGARLKVEAAAIDRGTVSPGELEVTKAAIRVGTGTSPLALHRVQPQGKRAMAAADWARGLRLGPGETLGD